MREVLVGVFVLLVSGGCAVKSEPVHQNDGTGGIGGEGGAGSGGGNVGGTTFLEEGETIVGSCMAPGARGPCQDYLATNDVGYTEEVAYMHCVVRYDDAYSPELWNAGDHCPLEGAAYACKHGTIIIYHYGDLLPEAEPEEACESGGQLVYWNRPE